MKALPFRTGWGEERPVAYTDAPTIPCATCGQPAAPSAGLCDRCRESYEASLDSDRRWWMEGGL